MNKQISDTKRGI